ncbi:MerR family transcriptional regulator [Listeria innocua]|uniref:MerR family transcriptional regulator n=1 Tax=Listeria innocua TaxID=1642 RepID=A0AB73H4Q6_LISIO|nr:MerR family transcriptional regulator [Listeria innocua]MBC2140725.1 MerR family transcriptional regulator [Listeria innocua]
MDELSRERAKKMSMGEIRKWQDEIIKNIESNYKTMLLADRKQLQKDLAFLEGIRDAKKGITSTAKLELLAVDEYKGMVEMQMSDTSIALELSVDRKQLADWKRKHGLMPYNKNTIKVVHR